MASNPPLNVVLYTRHGCHLCELAVKLLDEFGIVPTVVDIDGNETLKSRFDTCVPVVEIDGKVRFRGRVDPRLFRRIVRQLE